MSLSLNFQFNSAALRDSGIKLLWVILFFRLYSAAQKNFWQMLRLLGTEGQEEG